MLRFVFAFILLLNSQNIFCQSGPILFESTTIDLGKVDVTDFVSGEYSFENVSDKKVNISFEQTHNNLYVNLVKRSLDPKEKCKLTIQFSPEKGGDFDEKIVFLVNSKEKIELSLKGKVTSLFRANTFRQSNVLMGNRDITFKAIDAITLKGIPYATIFLENVHNHKSYIGKSNEHGILINQIPDGRYSIDGLIDGYKREIFGVKTDEERNIAFVMLEQEGVKDTIVIAKKIELIVPKLETPIKEIVEEKKDDIAEETFVEKKEFIPNSVRKVLNIIVLIDVSKSMSNLNRMDLLKKSLVNLINNYESNDKLALMTFNDHVNTLYESQNIQDKKIPIDLINSIQPIGTTDGVLGIDKAFDILAKNYMPDALNMVILASDGKISPYTYDDKKFYEKVEQMNEQAILTSVVGFGSSAYETNKLNKISIVGGGVFIDMNAEKENHESVLLDEIYKTLLKVKR